MKKRKIIIIALVICIALIVAFWGLAYLSGYFYFQRFISGPPSEIFVYSEDNSYCYIQLSSPKGQICTLYIYKIDENGRREYLYTLSHFFRDADMKFIGWGNNSHELYLDSRDTGTSVYKINNDQYVGPMFIRVEIDENGLPQYSLHYYARGENDSVIYSSEALDVDAIPKYVLEQINKYNGITK